MAAAMFCMAANAQTIFSENFNSTANGSMPAGWTVYADNLANYSEYSSLNQSWQVYEQMALSISYTQQSADCDRWMITPAITIPTADYSLVAKMIGYSANYPEKVRIMVSTTGTDKADFTEVADIVMDGTTYSADENMVLANLANYANQTVYIAFVNHGDGFYTFVDDIEVKVVEPNAISLVELKVPTFVPENGNFDLKVVVKNEGSANLTAFNIDYFVGSNTAYTNVTNVNVLPLTTYTYTISNLSYNTLGNLNITAQVSAPNGTTDPDMSDNTATVSTIVYDPAVAVTRHSIYEHFTTAQCGNCPSAHQRLAQAINGLEDQITMVSHHCGYYTDAMTIPESEALMVFYNDGGSTYAPASMIDRNHDIAVMSEDAPGPVFFPNQPATIRSQMEAALATPAFVTCSISDVTYDESTRAISFNVTGTFKIDMTNNIVNLTAYLIEDSVVGQQSGGGSKYVHDHVARVAFTGAWGQAIPDNYTVPDGQYTIPVSGTIPANVRANKCSVVAFLNLDETDVNSRIILNGAEADVPNTAGIADVEANILINTYPNPVANVAYINSSSTIRSVEVINTLGQRVFAEEGLNADVYEMDVRTLPQGLYMVKVQTDNGTATQKLNVVK